MKQEKKALCDKKRVPLLRAAEREKIRFDEFEKYRVYRRHWKKRWYQMYFITASVAILLALGVLFFNVSERRGGVLSSIISGFIRMEFMDPSEEEEPFDETRDDSADSSQDVWLPVDKPLPSPPEKDEETAVPPLTFEKLYSFDYDAVPNGAYPIIPMDLSLSTYGAGYIQNFTGFSPDTEALLQGSFRKEPSVEYLASSDKPSVLILHTHGTESYSAEGAISYTDAEASFRSENLEENVVSVGKVLADALEAHGIGTIHCTVLHDRIQYKDSYARAADTIQAYLSEYPSIKLVIDLHRDAVMKTTGEMVRPVTLNAKGEATAQVMCVVGSSWNGEKNDRWEGNLALALQFRAALNG